MIFSPILRLAKCLSTSIPIYSSDLPSSFLLVSSTFTAKFYINISQRRWIQRNLDVRGPLNRSLIFLWVLCWAKNSFGFFHNILQVHLNEIFSQPKTQKNKIHPISQVMKDICRCSGKYSTLHTNTQNPLLCWSFESTQYLTDLTLCSTVETNIVALQHSK